MNKINSERIMGIAFACFCTGLLTYYFSHSESSAYRIWLKIITNCVGVITELDFSPTENGTAYIALNAPISIDQSCSGTRFVTISEIVAIHLWFKSDRKSGWFQSLFRLALFLVSGLLIALTANVIRISTAIKFLPLEKHIDFLGTALYHEIHGITIFVTCLILFSVTSQKLTLKLFGK
ncbi:hypothetical protein FUAX_10690 [Fulvitalea axinellae]|uniref:Exosortase K n=1 Tax=Fulvitalea axinellae TaxID=1182444 RepID=A0AAU9CL24_9BACT|nr:hypothetical protein FUAX_10690 [Fulvitalea axinellae]